MLPRPTHPRRKRRPKEADMGKLLIVAMLLLGAAAIAQTPAPQDALEPGVNTSAPAATPTSAPPDNAAPAAAPVAAPSSSKPAAAKPAAAATNKPAQRSGAKDRLDLDSTQITGNR